MLCPGHTVVPRLLKRGRYVARYCLICTVYDFVLRLINTSLTTVRPDYSQKFFGKQYKIEFSSLGRLFNFAIFCVRKFFEIPTG